MWRSSSKWIVLALFVLPSATLYAGSPHGGRVYGRPTTATYQAGFVQGTPLYSGYGEMGVMSGDVGCDGCGCDTACAPACGSCCLRIIPAILGGVDCLLKKIFCCHGCGGQCGIASHRFESSCGCDTGCDGGCDTQVLPGVPSDPFIDDPEVPITESRYTRPYQIWNMPQPVRHVTSRVGATRVSSGAGKTAPRAISVTQAEPLAKKSVKGAPTPARANSTMVRPTSGDSLDKDFPRNPLRD